MWLQLHTFIEDVAEEAAAMAPSREALCSWLASYQSVLSKDLTWTEPGTNDIFPGCPSPPAELAQGSPTGGVNSAWAQDAMTPACGRGSGGSPPTHPVTPGGRHCYLF